MSTIAVRPMGLAMILVKISVQTFKTLQLFSCYIDLWKFKKKNSVYCFWQLYALNLNSKYDIVLQYRLTLSQDINCTGMKCLKKAMVTLYFWQLPAIY